MVNTISPLYSLSIVNILLHLFFSLFLCLCLSLSQFSSVQSFSCVQLFVTPRIAACQPDSWEAAVSACIPSPFPLAGFPAVTQP